MGTGGDVCCQVYYGNTVVVALTETATCKQTGLNQVRKLIEVFISLRVTVHSVCTGLVVLIYPATCQHDVPKSNTICATKCALL